MIAAGQSAEKGLAALERISDDQRLFQYQPILAAKAELLSRCGHLAAAKEAYGRSIETESDPTVRRFLVKRSRDLGPVHSPDV